MKGGTRQAVFVDYRKVGLPGGRVGATPRATPAVFKTYHQLWREVPEREVKEENDPALFKLLMRHGRNPRLIVYAWKQWPHIEVKSWVPFRQGERGYELYERMVHQSSAIRYKVRGDKACFCLWLVAGPDDLLIELYFTCPAPHVLEKRELRATAKKSSKKSGLSSLERSL